MNTLIVQHLQRRHLVFFVALFSMFVTIIAFNNSKLLFLNNEQPVTYQCHNMQMSEAEIAAYRSISLETFKLLQTQRGLTHQEICVMPNDKLERAIVKSQNPKPDQPDEAAAWRLLQLRDENGFIPPDGYAKAAQHIDQMRAAQKSNQSLRDLESDDWTWIGPGNIGGRVRSIVIHPTNPNLIWAGSISGGIWKTSDGGASWQPVDDFMANLAVSTLVMDPNNPNVMYAGTGEGFYNIDAIRGAGVFKTTDGGVSWTQLTSTANSDWYWVNRLAISPNGATILAATRSGVWQSVNGGSTWTQVNTDSGVKDIDFNPSNVSYAIAGGSYGSAWYSTNGGANWMLASGLPSLDWLGRIEVTYAPSNPSIVYASVSQNNGEIWKSANGGQSYILVNTGNNYLGSQGWYDNIVWVDPTDSNTIIVGGIDLWRSTNGGATLTKISQWWSAPVSAHADHHAIIEHPDFDGVTNKTVFFGNDGGVYKADNVYTVEGTSGWQELNNNLGVTQFYGAAGNATTGVIVGGTQDNGTLQYTGDTETWDKMYGGDGGFSAADPADPNYFYGEYVRLTIHRSTNGGESSSDIYSGLTDAGTCANFIAPFILDPNNPNTLLAGGCNLWRSIDVKAPTPTWAIIKSTIGSNVSAIAAAPGNSDIIWVGHNNGEVYKTLNGTATNPAWQQMDLNTPNLPDRYVTRLTVDPRNHNIVYVTFGGFNADNIWRTTDGGLTWSYVTGSGGTGLPDAPIRSLVIHPNQSNWLFAGTEVGVFVSLDNGDTWTVPHSGPANVSVDELFWMDTDLVAATHGRGLFNAPTCRALYEPNDFTGEAVSIGYGAIVNNLDICYEGDQDYFTFAGTAGDKVIIDIDAQDIGSSLDSYIYLYDSDGTTVLAQNDDEYAGFYDSKLSFQLTHTGTYYIMARAYNHPNKGDPEDFYTLRLYTDDAAPSAQITSPTSDSWLNPISVTVTAVATDTQSGVKSVHFYWHDADWDNSDWQYLGADMYGANGWQWDFDTGNQPEQDGASFYVYAYDWAGNYAGWGSYQLGIDRTPPTTTVQIQPMYGDAPFLDFWITWWNSTDNLSGVSRYDIQYRDGAGGIWTDLITDTLSTYARFVGQDGNTYYFRSRARDNAGNQSAYAGGDGDTQYTVNICAVSADSYEGDDNFSAATVVNPDLNWQTHNFHAEGDEDWLQFSGVASTTYILETRNTGGHADTIITVYDSDGATVLASNDNALDDWPASWLHWTPDHNGTFYVKVDHWDQYAYGCTTEYTLRIRPALRTSGDWQQYAEGGFGTRRTEYITALGGYNNHLYAGALNFDIGAQLWRTGNPWMPVTTNGFDNPYNQAVDHLFEFKGQLYAGLWADDTNGGEIWRTDDELTWTRVVSGGFGDPTNGEVFRLAEYNNQLYASTWSYTNTHGGEIWRSNSGDPGSWVQVVADGFGDANNISAMSMALHNSYLYASTRNTVTGGEIWRTSNGSAWSQINTNGFGITSTWSIPALAVYNNALYAGTATSVTGGEIWRCTLCDGSDWEQVIGDGFANTSNSRIDGLIVFDNELYAITSNFATGIEIWSSSDGVIWTQVNLGGFEDSENWGPYWNNSAVVISDTLYVGTWNKENGGEIWQKTAYAAAVATFSAAPTAGMPPLTVNFTNNSSGDYTSSQWNFGDGAASSQANPSYTYTIGGIYTVTLTVSGLGGVDTLTRTGYITAYRAVQAAFDASSTSGLPPLTVNFTNQSSGDYTSSQWNFGDGITSTQANPAHTYNNSGAYTVTLSVSGPGGADTSAYTNYIQVYQPVQANFSASPTSGPAPLTVNFTNQSSGDYTSSQWNFGDGATGSQTNQSHTYNNPGAYTVTLTASGPGGEASINRIDYINVSPVYNIYLPLVLKNYINYFAGPWESEPNDDALTQANGPIVSGQTYYGQFLDQSDEKDYFYITLLEAHTIEIWLSNIPSGQDYDLVLYDDNLQQLELSYESGNKDEHILSGVLPPGRYYIQVYNAGSGSSEAYHLRAVFR